MLYMLVRLYLSYSLFMQVGLRITLAVFYLRIKVNAMRITLHCINVRGLPPTSHRRPCHVRGQGRGKEERVKDPCPGSVRGGGGVSLSWMGYPPSLPQPGPVTGLGVLPRKDMEPDTRERTRDLQSRIPLPPLC